MLDLLALGDVAAILNKLEVSKLISRRDISSISGEIAVTEMSQDLTDDKSTLVQAMAYVCHQAPSHYLS